MLDTSYDNLSEQEILILKGGGSKGNFGEFWGTFFWGTPENPGDFPKIPQNSPKFPKKNSNFLGNYIYCFRSFYIHIPITHYIYNIHTCLNRKDNYIYDMMSNYEDKDNTGIELGIRDNDKSIGSCHS